MADLRNAVLATLAYYDVFDFPLTLLEVHRYLINPARFEKEAGVGEITVADVARTLDQLVSDGKIGHKNGYYMLSPQRMSIYETRIAREKTSTQKWKKLLRIARWFHAVPYVQAVFASGSMALHNAGTESDFDVLVVVKHSRLYTARVLISLLTSLFGARRTRHDKVAPDKFCFNHYITDAHLKIPYESLYNAQMYVNLRPVLDRGDITHEFYRANAWLNTYVYNFKPQWQTIRRSAAPSGPLRWLARVLEAILDTGWGSILEQLLRRYQQRRINRNPVTHAAGGRILFDDQQLEFHPHSAERVILERYNTAIRDLGTFWNYAETDSGLR